MLTYIYLHIIGTQPLYNNPPKLDELMKYAKQLENNCKKLGDELKIKKSLMSKSLSFEKLMQTWQKEQTVPYTWDTLLAALKKIGKNEIANEIEGEVVLSVLKLLLL